VLNDLEAAALGGAGVDDPLVGSVGVRKPPGPHLRELDGEPIADGREQRGRKDWVDAVCCAEGARIDPLPGDALDRPQGLLGLLGRLPQRDGRVGGIGLGDDAVVGGCGASRRREAREAETEAVPQEHPGRGQRSPVTRESSLRDESDTPHQQTLIRAASRCERSDSRCRNTSALRAICLTALPHSRRRLWPPP
jgi:hypothetical protein